MALHKKKSRRGDEGVGDGATMAGRRKDVTRLLEIVHLFMEVAGAMRGSQPSLRCCVFLFIFVDFLV